MAKDKSYAVTAEEAQAEFEQAWPAMRAGVAAKDANLPEEQLDALKPVFRLFFAQVIKAGAGSYLEALRAAVKAAEDIRAGFEKGGQDSRAVGAGRVAAHLSEVEAACRSGIFEPVAAWADGLQAEASDG